MRHFKRLTAILLAAILAFSLALPAGAKMAPGQGGGPAWELNDYPVILIHGIGQSEVFLYDEDNVTKTLDANGKPIEGWPTVDINSLIPKLIFPLLASLLLQRDILLTKTLKPLVKDILSVFAMDDEGRPTENMRVDAWHRYGGPETAPTSLGDLETLAPEQRKTAYGHLPLQGMSELVGEDKVYYFAYSSFGNLGDTVDELYELIQDILDKHDTDKVNIVAISLGGTIMNGLAEYYKDEGIASQLNNVVYVIAALDGSALAGDLFKGEFALDNENLYRDLMPALMDGYLGYLLNVVLRLLPKRMIPQVLDAVLEGLMGDVASYVTMLWGLVPQKDYPQAADMWLSDPKMAKVRAQTDRYYNAQVNSRKNILQMQQAGVNTYAIADYNHQMYPFVPSAFVENSDGLLQLDSPSLGATYGYLDTPLPDDYVPKAPGYMDKDRIVDASTGALPNHTWYFKDQDHERTGRCDVIMSLTLRLSCGADAVTVRSMDEWPQFNYGRDGRWLTSNLNNYADYDTDAIANEADRAEFLAAYAEMKRQAENTIVKPGETEAIQKRFSDIMVKLGEWNAPEPQPLWEQGLDKFARFLSEALYFAYGPRGFIDPIWRIWYD